MKEHKTEVVEIDPAKPQEGEKKILARMLSSTAEDVYAWSIYDLQEVVVDGQNYLVNLTRPLLKRPATKSQGFRYEVIGPVLGRGGFSEVLEITCTLKVTSTSASVHQSPHTDPMPNTETQTLEVKRNANKRRVAKKLKANTPALREKVDRETMLMAKAKHLHAKPPVTLDDEAYLVQRSLGSCELYDLLVADRKRTHPLTLEERFNLSWNILHAYETEVVANQLIHRDLKPENIRVNNDYSCHIIDYGLAKTGEEKPALESVGTLSYISPEGLENRETSTASDIYSLGRIFGLLWHDLARKSPKNAMEAFTIAQSPARPYLDPDLNLKLPTRCHLEELLSAMCSYDPLSRPDVGAAKEWLRQAYGLQFPTPVAPATTAHERVEEPVTTPTPVIEPPQPADISPRKNTGKFSPRRLAGQVRGFFDRVVSGSSSKNSPRSDSPRPPSSLRPSPGKEGGGSSSPKVKRH